MKRILSQSALYSGSRLLEKVLAFLVIALIARWHGAEMLGLFFYCFSLVSLMIPLMDVGYEKVMIRFWWKEGGNRQQLLGAVIRAKLISGCIALVTVLIVHFLVRGDELGFYGVMLAFVAIYADQWAGLFRRLEQIQERVLGDLIIPPLTRLGILVIVSLVMVQYSSAIGLLGSYAICCILGMLTSAYALWRVKPSRPAQSIKAVKGIWKEGYAYSLTHLFVMMSLFVDSVMLSWISLEQVGYYNAAYRMILVLAGLSYGACHVLFPVFSKGSQQDGQLGWGVLKRTGMAYVTMFGGLMLMVIIVAPWVVGLAYGEGYASTALMLRVLSPLILISAVTCLVGHWLEAIGHQRRVVVITASAALFNVLANLALIPVLGMLGAAITTLATEMVVLLIQCGMLWRVRFQEKKRLASCQPMIIHVA